MRSFVTWPILLCLLVPSVAYASSGGHGPGAEVWLAIAAILILAKLGGELCLRIGQPPVLGELLAGIVLGNLALVGLPDLAYWAEMPSISFLAELGVVLLLFEVGLESTLSQMRKVAPTSGLVAIIGVVLPIAMGFGASYVLVPDGSTTLHLFVGATLAATSVGITARVLQDLNFMQRKESQIILGAAVIDDVLGLVVLAVVSAIAMRGSFPAPAELAGIIGVAFGFLVGALVVGTYLTPGVFRGGSRFKSRGVLAALAIGFCLLLSGLAKMADLAPIVGAFAAGLILDDVHVRPYGHHSAEDLSKLVSPIVHILAPIFFVKTGMGVVLKGLTGQAMLLALALSAIAVVSKIAAGAGVLQKGIDRLTVGIGMIPRGEVGLIFAAVGASIVVDGAPLIGPEVYAAIVLMVMVSTVIAPPWLAARIRKTEKAAALQAEPSISNESKRPDSSAA